MPFDRDTLTSYPFPETRQKYAARDVILYALGLGVGTRPTDPAHLQFTYEKELKVLPMMAVVLAHPGFWAGVPELGIDTVRMLHGEQGLTIHRPLPTEGEVIGRSRIRDVIDRGNGRGAVVYYEREILDARDRTPIATSRQTLICRGNGSAGEGGASPPPPHPIPDRAPDHVTEVKTPPQMALIYRLSGDLNPLHADPEVARQAGFAAPILHGLATYGIGGLAIIESVCDFNPARLKSFDVRFTAPAYPGETIRTESWVDGPIVSVRSRSLERAMIVMDNGRAEIV